MGQLFDSCDHLGLVKVSHDDNKFDYMDKSANLGKIALTTVQITPVPSCDFPVAIQFFPKLHSHPCDYKLYYNFEIAQLFRNGMK